MTAHHHEIVVVGGGVVGAALTLALRRDGWDAALVERGPGPKPFNPDRYDPRVYAISPGSIAFLKTLGIWDAIAAQRVSPYQRMRVWENDPAKALAFDAAESGISELGCIVENDLLLSALWQGLGDAPIYRGVSVAAGEFAETGARLELSNGQTLSAQLAVAAEGADSKLRELAGIETAGWVYPQQAVVCHVETEQPHRQTAWQRFLPNGPLAFLPLADGRSSIVWSTEAAEAQDLMTLSEPEFRARLAAALQFQLGAAKAVTQRLSFPLRLLHAQEYARPGLALVGDSAHVIHPLAGQGVNLGLADAQALAGELAEAKAKGRSPGRFRTLKRYERRRKAENLEMLAMTDALYRMFGLQLPGWDALRSLGMTAVNRLPLLKRQLAARAMGLT